MLLSQDVSNGGCDFSQQLFQQDGILTWKPRKKYAIDSHMSGLSTCSEDRSQIDSLSDAKLGHKENARAVRDDYSDKLTKLARSFGRNYEFNMLMYNDDNVLNTLTTMLNHSGCNVDWDIQMNGLIARCSYKFISPNGKVIEGVTTGNNKKAAKKEAARILLTHMESPTYEEMESITKWMVTIHKNVINAVDQFVDKSFGGNGHVYKLKWNIDDDVYYGEAYGNTIKEAELYANQSLYCQTRNIKKIGSKQKMKDSKVGSKMHLDNDQFRIEELSKEDASQMNTLRNTVCAKMKVRQVETVTPCPGGFMCTLRWTWLNSDGTTSEKVVNKQGSSKSMAKACASKAMLVEIGTIDDVSPSESQVSTEIRSLIAHNIEKAVSKASSLIEESNCSVWRLFLPQLWSSLIHRQNRTLIDQITRAILSRSRINKGEFVPRYDDVTDKVGHDVEMFDRVIPTDLWENLLSITSMSTDLNFGIYVLHELRKLKLDLRYFHSAQCRDYYQQQSWLLALECHASISSTIEAKRSQEPMDESPLLFLELTKVQLPLLLFGCQVTLEYIRNSKCKVDDVVVFLPLYNQQVTVDSWKNGLVATIAKHRTENYNLNLSARFIAKLEYSDGDECFGHKDYAMFQIQNMVTHNRMMEALQRITHAIFPINSTSYHYNFTVKMRNILLGSVSMLEDTYKADFDLPTTVTLTPAQKRACISAIKNPLTLIQGPPGTGKTHLACAIIDSWNRLAPFDRVLAVADSNVAADNLIEGLALRNITALRIGFGSESELQEQAIQGLHRYGTYKQLRQNGMHKEANSLRVLLFSEAIRKNKIIIATCVGAGNEILLNETFPYVIIDECAQSVEPSNLIPIGRGCKSLVLIGDHKQLRPTVVSQEASRYGLGISLLERLATQNIAPVHLLNVQRRMHPTIAEFSNNHFYGGCIANEDVGDYNRPQIQGFSWPADGYNVAFVDASAGNPRSQFEVSHGTSKYNLMEVSCVLAILKSFIAAGDVSERGIGVLTPYDAQKSILRRLINQLEDINGHQIDVDSVDGFQGKEKDLIIFSAVRSNLSKDIGFLKDPRRMNVMLTRAKRGLIVIGDQYTLLNDTQQWAPYIEWAYSRQINIHLSQLRNHLTVEDGSCDSFLPKDYLDVCSGQTYDFSGADAALE